MSKNEVIAIEKLAKDCNHNTISLELCEHLKDWYGIEITGECNANIPESLSA